jgi:DNA-binding CsgD family transcriptional regulator
MPPNIPAAPPPATAVRRIEALRWDAGQVPPAHALPLGHVLEMLGAGNERQTVQRMLRFLARVPGSGQARACEYILDGAPRVRQAVAMGEAHPLGANADLSLAEDLACVARDPGGESVLGLRCRLEAGAAPVQERLNVLYSIAPNTAWAFEFMAPAGTPMPPGALEVLMPRALLVREVHRIVNPVAAASGTCVDAAEVRLGVRAPVLSERERQICARIAVGHTAACIAGELGISAATVATLRKRAYEKLGIHGRLDLRQFAA